MLSRAKEPGEAAIAVQNLLDEFGRPSSFLLHDGR